MRKVPPAPNSPSATSSIFSHTALKHVPDLVPIEIHELDTALAVRELPNLVLDSRSASQRALPFRLSWPPDSVLVTLLARALARNATDPGRVKPASLETANPIHKKFHTHRTNQIQSGNS
jgi:hypothetical protein